MPKKALITGIAGQDGSYLSNFLLSKGYEVHGTFRRNSSQEFYRLKELKIFDEINLHEVELTEKYQIEGLLKAHKYDEIYNLAAQSFVATSFNSPLYTFDVNTISLLNILECIKNFSSIPNFTKLQLQKCSGRFKLRHKTKIPLFILGALMVFLNWLLTGCLSIIRKVMIYF